MLTIDLTPVSEFRYNQISNHNFSFLLLDKDLRAVHSPFMCKDYLQDIFWSEYTGNTAEIYGISWKQGMFDVSVDRFNMALLGGKECLKERKEQLEAFLNVFGKAQEIPDCVVHETDSMFNVVLEFHKGWVQSGPLLSAFTALIRLSGAYSVGDDMEKYLKNLSKFVNEKHDFPKYMTPDINRMDIALPRLLALLQGKTIDFPWEKFDSVGKAHNYGLVGFSEFPTI